MDYNDGSNFGYDEINPYNNIPFEFGLAREDENNEVVLVTNQEYPIKSIVKPPVQEGKIEEPKLIKKLNNPFRIISREGFAGAMSNIADGDFFMIFILFLVLVMQFHNQYQLSKLTKLVAMGSKLETSQLISAVL